MSFQRRVSDSDKTYDMAFAFSVFDLAELPKTQNVTRVDSPANFHVRQNNASWRKIV